MKLLSVIIPSYNSEKFLSNCLDSLLIESILDKIELIVVNDGSRDKTSEIAHQYESKYPEVIKVIDKENGGHGSGINVGLANSTALYFKVLDSDDKFNKEGYLHALEIIEELYKNNKQPDLIFSDYVTVNENNKSDHKVVHLRAHYKHKEEIVSMKDFSHLGVDEVFMMHMLFLSTEYTKKIKLEVAEKVFYEDCEYVFKAVLNAKNAYYLSIPVYEYSVGSTTQSISLNNINKNYSHMINVMKHISDTTPYSMFEEKEKYQKRIARHHLYLYEILTFFYIYIIPKKEKTLMYKEYLRYYKKTNKKLYKIVRYQTPMLFVWLLPNFMRGFITKIGYKIVGKKKGWIF